MRHAMTGAVVGVLLLLAIVPASSAGNFFDVSDNGNVGIGTASAGALLDVARPNTTSNTELIDIRTNGFTQTISSGLTNARFNQFNQYTLSAATAQTVTNGTTLHIAGPPIASGAGPATITTGSALRIAPGSVTNTTNAYGLYVDAPTGATNNYSAVFPTGNVGIGTTSPDAKLHIVVPGNGDNAIKIGNGAAMGRLVFNGSSGQAGAINRGIASSDLFFGETSDTGKYIFRSSGALTTEGNVGIGTTGPASRLSVYGGASIGSSYFGTAAPSNGMIVESNVGIGTTSPGNILTVVQSSSTDPIADAWTTYSSIRWKEHIVPLSGALNKIEQLRTVYFDWKQTRQRDLGMIAEEVGKVLPEVVAYEPNGKDAKSIDYGRLTAVLVQAIKEQQAQIKELQQEIAALKHNPKL